MRAWIAGHPVFSYYLVAYGCSWAVALPLALQAQAATDTHLPFNLHYLSAFGPAIAAVALTRLLREGDARAGAASMPPPLNRWKWWMVGFASPLALFAMAQGVGLAIKQPAPGWLALGRVNFLPDLGLAAWPLWFLTSGVGEEVGWRGFALPRLQRTHSALVSSGLLAMAWAGWHLPAFFYVPSYAALGVWVLPGFVLGVLAGAIVLTWLYNSSGGSVLAVVLWHASFNFVTASPNAAGLSAAVTSTLVMCWAVWIVWRYDWATLTHTTTPMRSVRADRDERTRALPGDGLIPDPIGPATFAVTIRRPPRRVWPWLAQMGAGSRAGWYSYDFIDNGRRPSARRVVPDLQRLAVGMVFPALPGATDGFILRAYEPERFLTLSWPALDGSLLTTWTFVLEGTDNGCTRLIVRNWAGRGYRFKGLPMWLIKLGHFIMQRKQLLGIATRAETTTASVA